jgi:hypothetical protein
MATIFKPMEFSPQKREITFEFRALSARTQQTLQYAPKKFLCQLRRGEEGGWMQLSDKDFQLSGTVREKYVHSRFDRI